MWHLSAVDRYRNMQIMIHAGPIRQKLSPPLVGRKKNGFVCVSAVSVPLTPGLSRNISDCPERKNKSPLFINRCRVGFIWQFNVGKEMHGHVPTLKWIMAVWGYCHSSYLKHLLCCKRTKKKKDCRSIFNERVSIQRFSHFTGSPGRFWLMRCAEIQWLSSRMRSQFLTCWKPLKWTWTIQNPKRRLSGFVTDIWEQREEEKKRLKTMPEGHVERTFVWTCRKWKSASSEWVTCDAADLARFVAANSGY